MCVSRPLRKSHFLSYKQTLQSIIYPPEKKNSLGKAAFWHEVKVVYCLPTPGYRPLLTREIDYILMYPSNSEITILLTDDRQLQDKKAE